jgi:cytoskeletal protein CcmA (bactofilin family)
VDFIAFTTPPESFLKQQHMQDEEREMFGKPKDENDQVPTPVHPLQRPAARKEQGSQDQTSSISRGTTIIGKVVGEGIVHVFGQIEGELRAITVFIDEGATVEGDVVAEELTIGGMVKGIIHANRVKLNSSAVVEGDIFHRSLSIEENARFEGSSKREDNGVDVPRTSLKDPAVHDDPPTPLTGIQGNWKSNGGSNHDDRPNAGES